MTTKYDILGLGCTAVDELLYVNDYPPADGKARVLRREQHCGGLTATALVAAARLGGRCAFAGVLGNDDRSRFVLKKLKDERVDVRHAVIRADARPIRSTIIVEESPKTRTIFYDIENVQGAHAQLPEEKMIRSSRVLIVDNFGMTGMIRATRIARSAGIPVVADFEAADAPDFVTLLKLVDHLVISEHFARKLTGKSQPAAATVKLWNKNRKVVIVTCGAKGCHYMTDGDRPPKFFPAFPVKALDTTGCGDVFHGAYALGLARNLELTERIRFAAAAAAIKATRHGGQAGIPTLKAVEAFLKHAKP